MQVLINGSYQSLYFYSSRVGDGIIAPSLINANSTIKIGTLLEARIESVCRILLIFIRGQILMS